MGVICHGQSPDTEKEITRANPPIFLDKKYLDKIILIQKNYKSYNSRKKNIISNISKIKKELEFKKISIKY